MKKRHLIFTVLLMSIYFTCNFAYVKAETEKVYEVVQTSSPIPSSNKIIETEKDSTSENPDEDATQILKDIRAELFFILIPISCIFGSMLASKAFRGGNS